MNNAMKISFVWVLVGLVLVVTGGMLHYNTIHVMTEDTQRWLSLAVKTLDAAHENEEALMAITVTQDELIADMSKNLGGYDELCGLSYEQICKIRRKCEAVLPWLDGKLYNTVEVLLAEVLRLERALLHIIVIDSHPSSYLKVSEEAEL